jgi:hypothetical protein
MRFMHMTRRTTAAAHGPVLLALVLACADGASAQEKSQPRSPAKGAVTVKSATAVLTPAQLRDCLDQRDRLHKQTETTLAAKAKIAADKAEIDRVDAQLTAEKAALDRTSEEAVNAFNAKVRQQDAVAAAFEANAKAYNVQAEELQATRSAYEKTACENRRYDERDLEDLKRKK